jgi:NADH-quinone oxidoreductase subunit N
VLTGLRRDSAHAIEAAFKYFLLGAFASAFFLYGTALTYTLTGSTRLDRIASWMAAAGTISPMMLAATGLLLVGFAFKVSAVPFHMWTPDAYEGAPTVVTGFMSTGVKAAAFAAFARVFLSAFDPLRADWIPVLWGIAMLTMIVGTVVAWHSQTSSGCWRTRASRTPATCWWASSRRTKWGRPRSCSTCLSTPSRTSGLSASSRC